MTSLEWWEIFSHAVNNPTAIADSKTILTTYTNGSDKYYFFDGNDKTPRLPIITVDEEAYCFMKIKE